jgi:serine/threonine-protein kinase
MSLQLVPDAVIAQRFRLVRPLGKGGMGAVWEAHHLGIDIPCAVKFIEGQFAENEEMRARFEREAKAAALIRSPNVVQIYDHGVSEGTPYIAMELLVGEDLRHRLDRVRTLPPSEIVTIVDAVSRALTRAHSAGVVHRDLKPDNIFLVRDVDGEIPKVLDFGIAKQSGTTLAGSQTRTGAMLGTPYYMSPEQAQGNKAIDARSDLWSMAVIVFEALLGVRPFESDGLGDLIMRIVAAPLPVPSKIAPVPSSFDEWWLRAASRDPAARFQSAKEFADTLRLGLGATLVGLPGPLPAAPVSAATAPLRIAMGTTPGTATPSAPDHGVSHAIPKTSPLVWALPVGGTLLVGAVVAAFLALREPHRATAATGGAAGQSNASVPSAVAPPTQPTAVPNASAAGTPSAPTVAPSSPQSAASTEDGTTAAPPVGGGASARGRPHGSAPSVPAPKGGAPGGKPPSSTQSTDRTGF